MNWEIVMILSNAIFYLLKGGRVIWSKPLRDLLLRLFIWELLQKGGPKQTRLVTLNPKP